MRKFRLLLNPKILLCVYLLTLLVFVVFKFTGRFLDLKMTFDSIKTDRAYGYWNISLIPFKTITAAIRDYQTDKMLAMPILLNGFARDIVINIAIYMPLGFLLPAARKKDKALHIMLLCLLVVFSVESMQFIFCVGYFDVDDIIMNTVGCALGYFSNLILSRLMRQRNKLTQVL